MGQCTHGDIQIELQTIEDAEYVYAQLENIKDLVEARTKEPAHIDLHDTQVDGVVYMCNVYADRLANGDFHMEQVLEQVRVMVAEKHILPPVDFQAELLTQYAAWSYSQDEFIDDIPK